jgi:hypothetical protein
MKSREKAASAWKVQIGRDTLNVCAASAAAAAFPPFAAAVQQASPAITMRSACMCVRAVSKCSNAPVHPYMESAGIEWHTVKTSGNYCFEEKGTPRSSSGLKFLDESDAFVLCVLK